ncbi:MAG TPA: LapA family protein [Vicinamibacterales bacterium]|nr:LapA family protein [Vicinamibacterales bacterium]
MPEPAPPRTTSTPQASAADPTITSARPRSNQFKTYAICFLAGLLIGLVPVGVRLFQTQRERNTLQQQLRAANLELNLSSAAVMARHGDYTAARDAASRYFSDAKVAVDDRDGTMTAGQLTHLQSALADRDSVITLLSRGDPAGAERLTTMYVAHRAAHPR